MKSDGIFSDTVSLGFKIDLTSSFSQVHLCPGNRHKSLCIAVNRLGNDRTALHGHLRMTQFNASGAPSLCRNIHISKRDVIFIAARGRLYSDSTSRNSVLSSIGGGYANGTIFYFQC